MKVFAYLNHGRWVVDCPRPGCAAARQIDTPIMTTCECSDTTACVHTGNCRQPIMPVLPADRARIETMLERRLPVNRNWYPGETLDALQAENLTHGIK